MRKSWGGVWLGIGGKINDGEDGDDGEDGEGCQPEPLRRLRPLRRSTLLLPPNPRQRPLIIRPAARQQPKAAEAALVTEEEVQPEVDVGPAQDPVGGGAGAVLDGLVGGAEVDEHLAAV